MFLLHLMNPFKRDHVFNLIHMLVRIVPKVALRVERSPRTRSISS